MSQTAAPDSTSAAAPAPIRIGIPGLDAILSDGLAPNRLYLIDGEPGTGKTTLALQFLLEGVRNGERTLYVTLSETAEELRSTARSHGWSTDGIDVFELSEATPAVPNDGEPYTLFHPAEVELNDTIAAVYRAVERHRPTRVALDSLSEMRLLAREALRFRRQILALKHFFAGRDCTVLLLDDRSAPEGDLQLQSIAHGVVSLEHIALDYGAERRRLQVKKLRGARFRGGYHDFRIRTGGIEVFPRLGLRGAPSDLVAESITSGSPELDALLGGGIARGTSALVTGPAGTGKSVLVTQYALGAAARGERALVLLFDERAPIFFARAESLGMDARSAVESGNLLVRQVEPADVSPGELASLVMSAVDDGVRMVSVDSINGYMQAMPNERLLGLQVHELLSALSHRGVTTLMTLVQRGIFGAPVDEAAEVSYLADTVILLRYFEHAGAVRKAISVVKKRSGEHERTIRECRVDRGGLWLGEPLTSFRGVLTGVPDYGGGEGPLMQDMEVERRASLTD